MCRIGPQISHLFFVDDSLIFCHATMGDLHSIQEILTLYEHASRQQINKGKTTIFFNKAVSLDSKEENSNFLGVPKV